VRRWLLPQHVWVRHAFRIGIVQRSFNTAHYLLHAMRQFPDYEKAYAQQLQGIVQFAPSGYKNYTEWVYYAKDGLPNNDRARCPDGPHQLPNGDFICFVEDKCNGPFRGIMEYAFSEDGHMLELKAPWKGFLNLPNQLPAVQFGQKITVTMSLEVSGQYSIPANVWASDSVWPIQGYVIEYPTNSANDKDFTTPQVAGIAIGTFLLGCFLVVAFVLCRDRRRRKYDMLGDIIDTDGTTSSSIRLSHDREGL